MTDVCVLTSAHPVGDTRIFYKETAALKEAGYDVSLLAHHHTNEVIDDIDVVSVGSADSHLDRLRNLVGFYRTARRLDSDVYHFHDPGLLPVGALLSSQTSASVIYDCHENFAEAFQFYDFPPDIMNPIVARGVPLIESRLAGYCDGVVTATDWLGKRFRGVRHENVTTIHNYPN
jgi:hypothetical protein